jgi:putative sugar O-methyltransferase
MQALKASFKGINDSLTMRPKLKHLLHPVRTAALARSKAAMYVDIWRFGHRSNLHFQDDSRYRLEYVSQGFSSRVDDSGDDAALLERICTAYNKAAQREASVSEAYRPTGWWQEVRQQRLVPVIQALERHDIKALQRMYRSFFRDACSAGLIGVPYGMAKAYFNRTIKDIHRRFYLGDALYCIDYWRMQTGGRFSLRDLAGPDTGNPFGVLIEGTLVRVGAAYQHYSAQKIRGHLAAEGGTVAEIGGGFGGMAYYLLRDQPNVRYIDFDLPESLALTSYYLLKAFPQLNFLLYGEEELTAKTIDQADVVLMPLFEMESMPAASVDITFSSHVMADLSTEAISDYLDAIVGMTQSYLLYIGMSRAAESISNLSTKRHYPIRIEEMSPSGWHSHKPSDVGGNSGEIECLYRVEARANNAQTRERRITTV